MASPYPHFGNAKRFNGPSSRSEALEILNEMDHVVIRIVFGNMKLLLRRHAHGEETVLSMDVRAVPSGSFSRYCWDHNNGAVERQERAVVVQEFTKMIPHRW